MAKGKKYRYKYVGRKTKLTESVVKKLEEAFAVGANVSMACYYANISRTTFYNWCKDNPELLDRFEDLRQKIPLQALHNIAKGIDAGDIPLSERVLARRYPDEHADPIRITEDDPEGLELGEVPPEEQKIISKYRKDLIAVRQKRNIEQAKKDGTYIEPRTPQS